MGLKMGRMLLSMWQRRGVPSFRAEQQPDGSIVEVPITVMPDDPLFNLAVADALDALAEMAEEPMQKSMDGAGLLQFASAREYEIPQRLGHELYEAQGLAKGIGHKYIRRVPKPGGGYRYFYKVTGGAGGVGHESEMVVGAAFRVNTPGKEGHYHILSDGSDMEAAPPGEVYIRHDETGESMWVPKEALGAMLRAQHAQALDAHKGKLAADLADAEKHGASEKQKTKLAAEAGKYGVKAPEKEQPPPTKAKSQPGAKLTPGSFQFSAVSGKKTVEGKTVGDFGVYGAADKSYHVVHIPSGNHVHSSIVANSAVARRQEAERVALAFHGKHTDDFKKLAAAKSHGDEEKAVEKQIHETKMAAIAKPKAEQTPAPTTAAPKAVPDNSSHSFPDPANDGIGTVYNGPAGTITKTATGYKDEGGVEGPSLGSFGNLSSFKVTDRKPKAESGSAPARAWGEHKAGGVAYHRKPGLKDDGSSEFKHGSGHSHMVGTPGELKQVPEGTVLQLGDDLFLKHADGNYRTGDGSKVVSPSALSARADKAWKGKKVNLFSVGSTSATADLSKAMSAKDHMHAKAQHEAHGLLAASEGDVKRAAEHHRAATMHNAAVVAIEGQKKTASRASLKAVEATRALGKKETAPKKQAPAAPAQASPAAAQPPAPAAPEQGTHSTPEPTAGGEKIAKKHDKIAKAHGKAATEAANRGDGEAAMAHDEAARAHQSAAKAHRIGSPVAGDLSSKAQGATKTAIGPAGKKRPESPAAPQAAPAAPAAGGGEAGAPAQPGGKSKEGLPVIAIGPRGGKIVGYTQRAGKQVAIYEGSQAAAKLAASKGAAGGAPAAKPDPASGGAPAQPEAPKDERAAKVAQAGGNQQIGDAIGKLHDAAQEHAAASQSKDPDRQKRAKAALKAAHAETQSAITTAETTPPAATDPSVDAQGQPVAGGGQPEAPPAPAEPKDSTPLSSDTPPGGTPEGAPDPETLGSASPKTDSAEAKHQQEVAKMKSDLEAAYKRLDALQHHIDAELVPLFNRLKSDARRAHQNPSANVVTWLLSRVARFAAMVLGLHEDKGKLPTTTDLPADPRAAKRDDKDKPAEPKPPKAKASQVAPPSRRTTVEALHRSLGAGGVAGELRKALMAQPGFGEALDTYRACLPERRGRFPANIDTAPLQKAGNARPDPDGEEAAALMFEAMDEAIVAPDRLIASAFRQHQRRAQLAEATGLLLAGG